MENAPTLARCPLTNSRFFFNDTAPTEIYTLSLHDALPIFIADLAAGAGGRARERRDGRGVVVGLDLDAERPVALGLGAIHGRRRVGAEAAGRIALHHQIGRAHV